MSLFNNIPQLSRLSNRRSRIRRFLLLYLFLLVMLGASWGCHRHHKGEKYEHTGCFGGQKASHAKQNEHGHGGHGHGHGEKSGPDTGETVSVTLYTKKTELFMEYDPLVAGQKGSFLAHLTIVGKLFIPIRKGELAIDFVQNGRAVSTLLASKPLREGIFKPEGKVPGAGVYQLRLRLKSPKVEDTIIVKKAVIYSSVEKAKKANPEGEEDSQEISFLKEQQWKIPFATMLLKKRDIRKGLQLFGVGQALPSSHIRFRAPISGRISGLSLRAQEGQALKKGQRILYIEPILLTGVSLPQLQQDIRSAQAALKLSRRQLKRVQGMVRAKAAASWRLSQLQHQIQLDKARLRTALARKRLFHRSRRQGAGRGHAVQVRAPIDGTVLKRFVSNGTFVSQGEPLFAMASLRKVRLVAQLPEFYAHRARAIQSAWLPNGKKQGRTLGKPLSIGAAIDPKTRTLPLFFEVVNSGKLRHGQHIQLTVHLSKKRALAVPLTAIVDDQGTPTVFVLTGGESFVKRRVTTGVKDGSWLEILSGLKEGDIIVHVGAYEILLSKALKQSGAMDHGHAH